jgi:peroxiredoxin
MYAYTFLNVKKELFLQSMKTNRLINLISIGSLALLFFSACVRKPDRGYIAKVGDIVPDIEFQFDDGTKASLYSLDSKIVVLQFTASWCSVCRDEMPHLEKEVWQEFKDLGLMLIGVDYDEPLEKVKAFKEQMKVTYPMALDPGGKIFGMFANEGSGVTRNVVIDMKTKKIIFLTRLYNTVEFSKMIEKIETSL